MTRQSRMVRKRSHAGKCAAGVWPIMKVLRRPHTGTLPSRMKHLSALLLLALAACGTTPPPSAVIVPVEPEIASAPAEVFASAPAADVPAAGPLRAGIIAAAIREWEYFGQQTVVISDGEESIPHMGIWEDEDPEHSARINQYWRSVGSARLSGYDCREPWSAAFISWVMQQAGVAKSLFPPAGAHRSYLNHVLASAGKPEVPLLPHPIRQYQPRPGDLLCTTRGRNPPDEAPETLPVSLAMPLHCDIVVARDGQLLEVIGGNVRNSVSKTILTLSPEGYVQFSRLRPWFLIIENRLD